MDGRKLLTPGLWCRYMSEKTPLCWKEGSTSQTVWQDAHDRTENLPGRDGEWQHDTPRMELIAEMKPPTDFTRRTTRISPIISRTFLHENVSRKRGVRLTIEMRLTIGDYSRIADRELCNPRLLPDL